MKVSVVLPTKRPSGFDITFPALGGQTLDHNHWELILIDDYKDREKLAIEYAKTHNINNFKYLRSKPNYWRSNRLIANARNTGLICAEGELIVFIDDYIWFAPRFLEEHWKVYKRSHGEYNMIGSLKAVKYVANAKGDISRVPAPSAEDYNWDKRRESRPWDSPEQLQRAKQVRYFWVTDGRGSEGKKDCGGGWFYCANASAPLKKIIEINGFDEEYDLTSEEDIDLGLRLARVGCKFWYRPSHDCTVFHMEHKPVDGLMKDYPKKYKPVTYDELRRRGTLESNLDEIQLVLKEKYGVQYDGSWGLHERNRKRLPYANEGIFNLKEEREKRGYWT